MCNARAREGKGHRTLLGTGSQQQNGACQYKVVTLKARMATNVLLPLSGSNIGRNGVGIGSDSALRGYQMGKGPSPTDLSSFPGSVTRRAKGEEIGRAVPKNKLSRRNIAQEIDPSRYGAVLVSLCTSYRLILYRFIDLYAVTLS